MATLDAQNLNSGNGSVVPEVKGLDKRCNVRFSTDTYSMKYSKMVDMDLVIDMIFRGSRGGGGVCRRQTPVH